MNDTIRRRRGGCTIMWDGWDVEVIDDIVNWSLIVGGGSSDYRHA